MLAAWYVPGSVPCSVCESASENTDYLLVLEVSPNLPGWEWVGWTLLPQFWSHPMGGRAPLIRHFLFCQSLVAQTVKRLPTMRETQVRSLGREDPLEKEVATHSSILAWKIPWTEEPGRLTVHGVAKSQTGLSDFTLGRRLPYQGGAQGGAHSGAQEWHSSSTFSQTPATPGGTVL